MLTEEGWGWIANWIAGEVRDGWVVVSDGQGNSGAAPVNSAAVEEVEGGYRLVVSAIFKAADSNFAWAKRALKLKDGTEIEAEVEDLGTKVEGAEWELALKIDFVTGS